MLSRAFVIVGVVTLGACAVAPAPRPATTTAVAPAPAPAAGPSFDPHAPPRIETETFALELNATASTAITVTLEGRGGHHVNLEYPMRVQLGGSSAAQLEKPALEAADAAELGEARARFVPRVRWSAPGQHWIAARVQFAMCTAETCTLHEEALALPLSVP